MSTVQTHLERNMSQSQRSRRRVGRWSAITASAACLGAIQAALDGTASFAAGTRSNRPRKNPGRQLDGECQTRGTPGRALSFGAVAAAYERFRPGYPSELAERVLAYAQRPVRTALEIGAGTGKATRAFTGRGIAITTTEPDAAMLAELRQHVPADVITVQAAFEDLRLTGTYGLVFAAAALHWTEPAGRWPRMAALLEPGGVFASFGGQIRLADEAVQEAVRAARAPFLENDGVPSPDGTLPESQLEWPGTELQRSDWFADVQQALVERRLTMSARDYVGHLSTISAYLQLQPSQQEQVLGQIMRVLPEQVSVTADITVHLAQRRDCAPGSA